MRDLFVRFEDNGKQEVKLDRGIQMLIYAEINIPVQ